MSAFRPIAPKLAKLLLLLGSENDGEALGAARGLGRTLAGVGCDLHDLAETLIQSEPPPARNDISLRETVTWILDHDDGSLNDRERAFVEDMDSLVGRYRLSDRQEAWLRSLHLKLRRRRP